MAMVEQSLTNKQIEHISKIEGKLKKEAAFKYWQYKLKKGEKLPRGKFFQGKKSGKPFFIKDEFYDMFPTSSFVKSHSSEYINLSNDERVAIASCTNAIIKLSAK